MAVTRLAYKMEGGRRYEVGSAAPLKIFGTMLLLVFSCGNYLRYKECCLVTDSAYGYIEGLMFISLLGIHWVTSFSPIQRRGCLGIKEFPKAADNKIKKKKAHNKKMQEIKEQGGKEPKRNFSKEISAREKEQNDEGKDMCWYWKATMEIMKGFRTNIWLTAIKDSRMCWRLDNYLGPSQTEKINF